MTLNKYFLIEHFESQSYWIFKPKRTVSYMLQFSEKIYSHRNRITAQRKSASLLLSIKPTMETKINWSEILQQSVVETGSMRQHFIYNSTWAKTPKFTVIFISVLCGVHISTLKMHTRELAISLMPPKSQEKTFRFSKFVGFSFDLFIY